LREISRIRRFGVLLLVGADRDKDDRAHPLIRTSDVIRGAGARVEEIVLTLSGSTISAGLSPTTRSINALADCTQNRDDLEGPAAERHRNSARPEFPPAEVDFPLVARIHQICSRFRHLPSSENLFA
jgi:hypothetical protein